VRTLPLQKQLRKRLTSSMELPFLRPREAARRRTSHLKPFNAPLFDVSPLAAMGIRVSLSGYFFAAVESNRWRIANHFRRRTVILGDMRAKLKKGNLSPWSSLLILAATVTLAQTGSIGSEPPKLHGLTLDGQTIVLPDASLGKVTLLLIGASRKGGQQTGRWREQFVADFGSDPRVTYYAAALLQGAPSILRGMIRSGMRKGTPAPAQPHVLTSASDDAAWKKYLNMQDDGVPAVLLLDQAGHLRWSYNGIYQPDRYQSLKTATADILRSR
jgi:hypothetical protein